MDPREELAALRRLAELEAKAGGATAAKPAGEAEATPRAALAETIFRMLPGPFNAGRNMADFSKSLEGAAYQAGGAVTDTAAKVASPEVAAGLGTATNVGIQSIPSLLGMGAGAKAAPMMEAGAKKLMTSALKPTLKAHQTGQADRAVQTMLDEGVNVTAGGVEKLHKEIDILNNRVKEIIKNSTATVDKQKVTQALDNLVAEVKQQVAPGADVAAVTKVLDEFANHELLKGIGTMPVQLAHTLKTGTQQSLGRRGAYGATKDAGTEAEKRAAHVLRTEVAAAEPAAATALSRESDLINAAKLAQRRVLMDQNKNPIGLGLLHPETLLLWLLDRSPAGKSSLARLMYSGSEAIPQAAGGLGGLVANPYLNKRE